ncbi:MAG: ABC transporter ATP-binding protein [Candidatus Doudnabacteria bacterium]|nr:ABC transporter ATP-binding protein [Candidatus Doudnabacteria bacterium]
MKLSAFSVRRFVNVSALGPLPYLFTQVWKYSSGRRLQVALYWTMFIGAEIIDLWLMPYIWSQVINIAQVGVLQRVDMLRIGGLLAMSFLWTFGFWSLHGPARVMECSNAFWVRANYRRFMLGGVLAQSVAWHVIHHSGTTNDRLEKGATALYSFTEDSFEVVYAITRLVVTGALLYGLYRPAMFVVGFMILVTAWIIIRFDRILIQQYQALNAAENQVAERVLDSIANITTVIILRVEKLVFSAIMHRVEEPYTLFRSTSVKNECKWFVVSVCCRVTIVAVLFWYFLYHYRRGERVSAGHAYLLINYLQKIADLFGRFAGMYGDVVQRRTKLQNAELLSESFEGVPALEQALPAGWAELEVQDVSFGYEADKCELHLDGVSLKLRRGKRYAFVGHSGSGKTTFLKLMRGLYPGQAGRVCVDGNEVPQAFLGIAQAIALIPQHPEIFASTIWHNITLGAEYDASLVHAYAHIACFDTVVERLPLGYDSDIRERGVNLSGGQQQRLALTRGLLACHSKEIVLLDEPTSSLDAATEQVVYERMFAGFPDKLLISSIHRLHLLPLFDEVILFDGGRVLAQGSLDGLLAHSPEFRDLWEHSQRHKTHHA